MITLFMESPLQMKIIHTWQLISLLTEQPKQQNGEKWLAGFNSSKTTLSIILPPTVKLGVFHGQKFGQFFN